MSKTHDAQREDRDDAAEGAPELRSAGDTHDIDRLARALTDAGTRRMLLGALVALPLGGLANLLAETNVDTRGRRENRHNRRQRRQKKRADCGSSPCDAPCDVCPIGCKFSSVQFAINTLPAGSTIRICDGTYGAIHVTKNLTLIGKQGRNNPATTLDAAGGGRVVEIDAGVTATLQHLRITGGVTVGFGGGILNGGTTTMTRCTINSNSALNGGGIHNAGSMTLTDCRIGNNSSKDFGGGIRNEGTATLNGCGVLDNTADWGGGIFNKNEITLNDTFVTGNRATRNETSGGIDNYVGTVKLQNGSYVNRNSSPNCRGTIIGGGCGP